MSNEGVVALKYRKRMANVIGGGVAPDNIGSKEFYVCFTNSRGALTPSNVHRTFSVRLIRFTANGRNLVGGDAFAECIDGE